MAPYTARLVFFAVLAAFSCAEVQYTSCTSSNDCLDTAQPYCAIYYLDMTYNVPCLTQPCNLSTPVAQGVCVQCLSDCDCGVNQYCGPGYTLPAFTSSNTKATQAVLRSQEALGKATAGLKINSECMNYGEPVGQKCVSDSYLGGLTHYHIDKNGASGSWVLGSVPGPIQTTKGYCAKVNSWIPEAKAIAYIGSTPATVTRLFNSAYSYNSPGVCKTAVYENSLGIAVPTSETGPCATSFSVGENTVVSAVEWQGYCENMNCQICQSLDTRCTTGRGTPQRCYEGVWIAQKWNDQTIWTLTSNVSAQLLMAIWWFIFFLFVATIVGLVKGGGGGGGGGGNDKAAMM